MSVFIKNSLIILFLCGSLLFAQQSAYSPQNQLDLNNASFEQISGLPIPITLAEEIYQRITYQGPLKSVYELNSIKGMTPELFQKIKPLVKIEPYMPKTDREQRLEELYYRLSQWEGDEGASQSLVDSWIERALEPYNVNTIDYEELVNLQSVSPVDAAAILNYRREVGKISSARDLRSAPFLSYYGYRNALNFLSFEPTVTHREVHGHLLTQMDNTPFMTEEAEAIAQIPLIRPVEMQTNTYPGVYTRFYGTIGQNAHFGYIYYHSLNEPFVYRDLGFAQVPRAKIYLGIENQKLGPVEVRKLYVGNYALAFGQGVVMENNDYFQPRKSGFGWRKRFLGLSGDNSRTREYKLTGLATELVYHNAHAFLFGAFDKRDAILNKNTITRNGEALHAVNQLIVLDQRFEYAPLDSIREKMGLSWRGNTSELLYGMHLAYDFLTASQIGFTYYESAYDRLLRPEINEIVASGTLSMADNEIFNSYGGSVSDGENPFWAGARSFRRVYGADFRTVYRNLSLQGEYAELDKAKGVLSGNPHALVLNAYIQYSNFYILGLYRDYQLEFDNPYQRSFSNYRRFKRTIYEDYFYLQDPQYGQLYTNNPQPQAEKGYYIYSRYQINRQFVTTVEYDNWRRVADDATQYRLVGTLDFRPIFPLRFNLRQKFQGREVQNNLTTEYFENFEFRGRITLRLSRYDDLGMLYVNAVTKFRPRPRFLFPVETGSTVNFAGNIASPGEALGGFFTHNFNDWMKVRGFLGYYKGFFWSFEDTQFMVMDSNRGSLRFWISLYTRITPQVSFRMKYTRDYNQSISYIQTRTADNTGRTAENGYYYQGSLYQPSQAFYYLEFNFHF